MSHILSELEMVGSFLHLKILLEINSKRCSAPLAAYFQHTPSPQNQFSK